MGGPATDLEKIFNLISQPAIVVNRGDGSIVALNNAISGRLGENPLDLTGTALSIILQLEDAADSYDRCSLSGTLSLDHRGPIRFVARTLSCSWRDCPAEIWLFKFGPDATGGNSEKSLFDYPREPA